MKSKNTKMHHYNALNTAAAMIRGQFDTGATPEEVGFDSQDDMNVYIKECQKVAKTLFAKAARYQKQHNLFNNHL